ncbi:MAG: beta-galactosidase trimerization domain-containing protein, partial [Lentisphaeria bacterium]|nr:beta-galactosidase trimerization domain-containing protein [Lentisphaeria bacterium]
MDGCSGVAFYGNFTIDPAYNIAPGGERLIKAYSPWTNGTAEAVMRSSFKASPVAFHYTPASIKADWFIGLDKMRQLSTDGFRLLQQDSFLPYDYVAYGQMEKAGIPARYKVMVLPLSAAMSDKEIAAAAEFVRKGGTLVADLMPGFYDQHGAVRENTAKLYELFGMKKMGKARECPYPLIWQTGRFKIDYADFEAQPGSARSYGRINGKPAFFVNRFGKGKTVYMGCSLTSSFGDWDAMRYSPGTVREAKLLHAFWSELLSEQKIFSEVQISGITDPQIVCRTIANGMLLAVIRNPRG